MPKSKISKTSKEPPSVAEPPPIVEEVEEEEEKDLKHIRIAICGYKNIIPTYSVTDLTVQAIHADVDMGMSTKTTVTDDVHYITSFEFVLECDINSSRSLDKIVTHPVVFKIFEHPGQGDPKIMAQVPKPLQPMHQEKVVSSAESALELNEAFGGKPIDKSAFVPVQSSKKSLRGSKGSVSGGKGTKSETPEVEYPKEPILMGSTNLDLLPLFTGHKCFTESLLIYKLERLFDDQMVPVNIMPRLIVEVTIDEDSWLSIEGTNILSLTVESIYNIPDVFNAGQTYKASTYLPSPLGKFEHVIISDGVWKDIPNLCKMKQWPRTDYSHIYVDDKLNQDTKYRIDDCLDDVQNKLEIDLDTVLGANTPIVEFNSIKRNYLSNNAARDLHKVLKKYRHIPFELYIDGVGGKSGENTHLMAEVNVSTLLYPGVTKIRVVCPLSTYKEKEIQQLTGIPDTPWTKKQPVQTASPVVKQKGQEKKSASTGQDKKSVAAGQDKKSVAAGQDKKSVAAGHDKKSVAVGPSKNDLKTVFNQPEVKEEEPSLAIYNADNMRTFVLLEIELLVPLEEKRTIEDLTQCLLELLPPRPRLSKHIISEHLSEKYFTAVIKKLLEDLLRQHDNYINDFVTCPCTQFGEKDLPNSFLTFLRKGGIYQTYVTTMSRAITTIVSEKSPYVGDTNPTNKDYQDFISTVYSDLIKQSNSIINEICNTGVEVKPTVKPLPDSETVLLYAKEACELGATLLADRYFLERICQSEHSGSYWFDYAVFQLELEDRDKAYECVRQSLLMNDKCKYSLVLFAVLLYEKNLHDEAETCLLSAMLLNPKWLEGWGTMHLFYTAIGNIEGADFCQEMANKCIKNYKPDTNYFVTFDDLAWTTEFCPQTIFFKTAVFLIKMRALQFAERALVLAERGEPGLYHYYLAVIMYYHHNYDHCLMHLQEAERIYGLDYAIGALKGHCYLALECLTKAKEEYCRVLEMFNRPTDVHLVYVFLALIYERIDEKQESRKLLLLACKYSPTPYTWLATGLIYYGQRDLISAEQCLLQANLCDNRLAEVWGYLVIINLELGNYNEAEMCYKQSKKNKIENIELLEKIEEAQKSIKKVQ